MVAFGRTTEGLTYLRVDLAKDPMTLPPFSAVLRVQAQDQLLSLKPPPMTSEYTFSARSRWTGPTVRPVLRR
jgi:hypothetical protein